MTTDEANEIVKLASGLTFNYKQAITALDKRYNRKRVVFKAAYTAGHRKTPIELTYSSISSTARLYTSTLETIEKLGKNNLEFGLIFHMEQLMSSELNNR